LRPSASGSRKAWLLVCAALLIGSTLDIFLLPVLNPTKSDRQFGMRVRELTGDSPVYLYGSDFAGRFNLWTGRLRMPRFWDKGKLRRLLANPQSFVVSERAHFLRALTPEEIDYYTVAEGRLDEDRPLLLKGRLPAESGTSTAPVGAQLPRPKRSDP
jgi:hypothetical protein